MANISRLLAFLVVLGSFSEVLAQQQSLTLNAAPPGGFLSLTAQAQNPFGASSPCYWVVPKFAIGNGPPSAPNCTPPTVGTTVLVSWTAVTGATAYDLLRTTSAVLPPAGISTQAGVVLNTPATSFTDTGCCGTGALLSYTVTTASAAMATFLLDNQNQSTPQVRLTISNATGTTSSFLLGLPANNVLGPGSSTNGFIPVWSGTTGTQLSTGLAVSQLTPAANSVVQTAANGFIAPALLPTIPLPSGSGTLTISRPNGFAICTSTCTINLPAATGGSQFCVQNTDNVATVITILPTAGAQLENTSRTSYKALGATLVSGGAIGDQICMIAVNATQWNVWLFTGTWT